MHLFIILVYHLLAIYFVDGDFIFEDFRDTTSLTLNGVAATAHCASKQMDTVKFTQHRNEINESLTFYRDENGLFVREMVTTYTGNEDKKFNDELAGFGHRDIVETSISDSCRSKLRLTPSLPSTVGSLWYNERLHVVSLN